MTGWKWWGRAAFLVLLLTCISATAHAQQLPLIADASNYRVNITTGFTGTDVVYFGAKSGPGDIVVVVRGPNSDGRPRWGPRNRVRSPVVDHIAWASEAASRIPRASRGYLAISPSTAPVVGRDEDESHRSVTSMAASSGTGLSSRPGTASR